MASDASTPEPTSPCPIALAAIETVDPVVLAAMVPNFDPTNAVMVRDVAKFVPKYRTLSPAVFASRVAPKEAQRSDSHVELFQEWLALSGFDATSMTGDQLVDEAGKLAEFLRFDCAADHPMLRYVTDDDGNRVKQTERGRASVEAYRPGTLKRIRLSLRAFVKELAGKDFADQLDTVFVTRASAVTPRAQTKVDLTPAALEAMVAVLDERGLEGQRVGLTGAHSAIWHARQRAVLLVSVAGVLRASETTLRDEHRHVHPSGTSVIYRVLKTKTGAGRDVRLPYLEGSNLCPLTAIETFHKLCEEHGYDRDGYVLPYIPADSRKHLRIRPGFTPVGQESLYLKWVAAEVDHSLFRTASGGPVPENFLEDGQYRFGTHALRRFLPSVAAREGHDLAFISSLGGGAWTDPKHRSMVTHYLGMQSRGELSQALLDEIDADLIAEGEAG